MEKGVKVTSLQLRRKESKKIAYAFEIILMELRILVKSTLKGIQ